ncbi:hypothetical protein KSP39_PZI017432 [Platanthera zijinensis]|uniref:K Homology domain-containing protein n=1 Tax=Platanthera zijinensis TaxID=2320716 RepID=A0AAP0B4Q9_9ASPA
MNKQSDLVNPNSAEECGNHARIDDEFDEYSKGEMLGEEPNEEGSSNEESAEEISCGEESDDADSCAEGSNEEDSEELEEALEEDNDDDASGEEINEDEISEVSEEKPNRKEALKCSMDQISTVNDSDDVPSLLEEKKASDAVVDVPQISGKRRRSGWDVKAEDVVLVNDSSDLGKKSETGLCSGDLENYSGEESYEEDSDEELEEAFEEYSGEDDSVKETNEEEINKESTTSCSMDQLLLINKPPKLLEEKVSGNLSAATVVDVPRVSSKRRPSRWDIKSEDLVLVNDGGNLVKREIRRSTDIKAESSALINDSAVLNKRRKTRWSSDKSQPDKLRPPKHRSSRKVENRLRWLNMKLELVNNNLEHYLTAKTNLEKQSLSSPAIDDVRFAKLLEEKDFFVSEISRMKEEKKNSKYRRKSFKFKKMIPLPMKEYSGYNLAGLLLGPNGSTLKEMEEKTGSRLSLRGKDGSYRRNITNCADIHLMIKANKEESIDAAVSMIEELWQQKERIKAAQLRELAKINGTLRGGKTDFVWTRCDICGDLYHPASGCPLAATDAETVKKFHTGPGSLFSSYGDKDKCETQIMPTEVIVNCMPPILNDKKLVVGIAATSPPSPNANLPRYPGLTVVPPSSWNTNLAVPPSTSNANAPSHGGFATISPSSNVNLPSYPGHAAICPSSSIANLPNYPRPAPSPPSSTNLNLPSYSKNVLFPMSSSIAKPPNYTRYVAIPPSFPINHGPVTLPSSSSNANLSTRPVPPVVPPTFSKANLQSYPTVAAVPPSSNANLPNFPGFVVVPPSSSNANRPSFPGIASIPPPSSNINRSSYAKFAANPPASSNANIPSYPKFTVATPSSSNSNLPSYAGLAAIPPPSSNAKPPSSNYVDLAAIPLPSSNAKPPSHPKSTAIRLPSSNENMSSYTRLAPVPPSSPNANLPIRTGFAAIPPEIPKSNNWPGPPGSSLLESSSSFLKSGYNSSVQTGSARLQTSIPLGSNAHILDRKKPVPTDAPPSPSSNFLTYPEFAATSREIAVPNCWPHPTVSTPPGSRGQLSTFSSQFPGITAISKEFASFPGYTGLAAICPPTSKVNLPSYPGLTAIPKTSSNANLSSDGGHAAIPGKASLSNNWPGSPLPLVPESGSSFFKSSSNSPAQTGSAPFQSSASLDKNADILDVKKLELTVTSAPLPPLNPNSRSFSNFAVIPPEVPERNFWPRPTVSILPESGTSLPESIYGSFKYSETKSLPSSAPLVSTGQAAVSSSHLPYAVSNELTSFPGYPDRIKVSYPFDRPVPLSSLSFQRPHFTSNFSGNKMNPSWRNYNHPTGPTSN